jgi:hypothetical protein
MPSPRCLVLGVCESELALGYSAPGEACAIRMLVAGDVPQMHKERGVSGQARSPASLEISPEASLW